MSEFKIGLIGLGTAGMRHAGAIQKSPAAKIVAAADPAPNAAQAAASLDVPLFAGYEAMLNEADLDAVVISLPHNLLTDAALAAAKHHKHILLEKPMSTTSDGARSVVDACRDADVKLMVNFVHRFRAESRQAYNALRSGAIGDVLLVVDMMTSGYSPVPPWIWQKEKSGGGIMLYNGVHSVDRMIWLAGAPVAQVTGAVATLSHPIAVEDNLVGTFQFANGALGAIVQHKSQAKVILGGWHTTVYGSTGSLRFTSGEGIQLASEKEKFSSTTQDDDRFLGAFQEFAAALKEHRQPVPSGADAVHALDTVFALYESAEKGQRIEVGTMFHKSKQLSVPTSIR